MITRVFFFHNTEHILVQLHNIRTLTDIYGNNGNIVTT